MVSRSNYRLDWERRAASERFASSARLNEPLLCPAGNPAQNTAEAPSEAVAKVAAISPGITPWPRLLDEFAARRLGNSGGKSSSVVSMSSRLTFELDRLESLFDLLSSTRPRLEETG